MSKELIKKYEDIFQKSDLFEVHSIGEVNHDPHPYVVTAKHVTYAADNWNGTLTDLVIMEAEDHGSALCGHQGCNYSFTSHSFEKALFLKLKRDGTQTEGDSALKPLRKDLEEDKIDGFVMIDTPEKYRIT